MEEYLNEIGNVENAPEMAGGIHTQEGWEKEHEA